MWTHATKGQPPKPSGHKMRMGDRCIIFVISDGLAVFPTQLVPEQLEGEDETVAMLEELITARYLNVNWIRPLHSCFTFEILGCKGDNLVCFSVQFRC